MNGRQSSNVSAISAALAAVSNAPLINGTFVLNDANVQVNNTGTWNTVYDYQFSYEQSGPTTHTDPVTGKSISYAGYLDLTQLKEVGDDGATAYPPSTFSYTSQDEYYEDGSYTPYLTAACGPSAYAGKVNENVVDFPVCEHQFSSARSATRNTTP